MTVNDLIERLQSLEPEVRALDAWWSRNNSLNSDAPYLAVANTSDGPTVVVTMMNLVDAEVPATDGLKAVLTALRDQLMNGQQGVSKAQKAGDKPRLQREAV